MDIDIQIDTKQLNQLAVRLAVIRNRFKDNIAKAMTYAAYDSQKELKRQTPSFVKEPTPWTVNSTFVRKATTADLSVILGFKDTAVKGTPAAKYLQPMVAGQPRRPKSTELQLQRSGLIPSGRFITPTDVYPLNVNKFGNIAGPTYVQMLSRLKAFGQQGYTANASDSTRSQAKRSQRDYFIGRPGGLPLGIYARVGRRAKNGGLPRGFHTVFYVTKQPKYEPQFPVREIVQAKFNDRFPSVFERLVFTGR